MPNFFSKFPKIAIKVEEDELTRIAYTDLFRFVDVNELRLPSFQNYTLYEIENGDRPDTVSQKLYDTPNFYWTFFIINDHLKDGMEEWPMTNQALDKFVDQKYNSYGIASVYPSIIQEGTDLDFLIASNITLDMLGHDFSIDLMEELGTELVTGNLTNGIDISHPYLRVRRLYPGYDVVTNGAQDNTQNDLSRGYAKIKRYDRDRYHFWFEDVEDTFFFSDEADSNLLQLVLINPYATYNSADPSSPIISDQTKYDEVEAANDAWIESIRPWYTLFFGEYTGSDFKSDVFANLKLNVTQFYEDASLAPEHYISGTTGDKLVNNLSGDGNPIPYYEYERDLNLEKRFIRVLKGGAIRKFSEAYHKTLTRTGRINI